MEQQSPHNKCVNLTRALSRFLLENVFSAHNWKILKKRIIWLNEERCRSIRKNRANLLSQDAPRKLRTRYTGVPGAFLIRADYAGPSDQDQKQLTNKVAIYATNSCFWNDRYRWSGVS
jgi:hypothetical protein